MSGRAMSSPITHTRVHRPIPAGRLAMLAALGLAGTAGLQAIGHVGRCITPDPVVRERWVNASCSDPGARLASGVGSTGAVAPAVTSPAWNQHLLRTLWIRHGGDPAEAATASAVAMAESGGKADAANVNTDGSTDRGLWQINDVHGPLSTFDPDANAAAAVAVHRSSGWGAWTTYNTGAYRAHLQP